MFSMDALSDLKAQYRFRKFRTGDETLGDASRSGRHCLVNNETLQGIIETNLRATFVGAGVSRIGNKSACNSKAPQIAHMGLV